MSFKFTITNIILENNKQYRQLSSVIIPFVNAPSQNDTPENVNTSPQPIKSIFPNAITVISNTSKETTFSSLKFKLIFWHKKRITQKAINTRLPTRDIVNITLHFFLKDVRPMQPLVMNRSIAVS